MSQSSIAKTPLRQVQNVKSLLHNDQARAQLALVAAKHMNPERMMRVVANAIRTTPKLEEAEPMSFLGALMQCAALGLEPNTVLGHAYLIPFKNNRKGLTEVQVIIGYKGLIDLARRSGHITSISANVHYDDDELWDYEEGTEAKLRHRPGPQEGKKLHAYAIAKFKDGGHAYVVLPWAVVIKTRNGSQNWQSAVKFNSTASNPWATHEAAMAKKTAIRALAKYLPLSVEFSDAQTIDHEDGAKMDYAAFALSPSDGVMIDGDVITGGDDDGDDDAKAPEEKPVVKPVEKKVEKQASEKPFEKPKADPEPSGDDAEEGVDEATSFQLEQFSRLAENILADIAEAAPDSVDDVLGLYLPQIEQMESLAPDLYKMISDAADDRIKGTQR